MQGGICLFWGLDKDFTLTLLAESLTTVPPTVQPMTLASDHITKIVLGVLTGIIIISIAAWILYKKRY